MGVGLTPDIAGEAERRYCNDPEFKAAVDCLRDLARRCAFTPYELKQAAYMAALLNEIYSARNLRIDIDPTARRNEP